MNDLPRLALNLGSPNLSLPSSMDYRREPLPPSSIAFLLVLAVPCYFLAQLLFFIIVGVFNYF
jgi:hypothetical protein